MSRARVLLVDDNDDFLDGVVDWMAHEARVDIVARAHTGAQALERIETLCPDLVVMDVSLPDMTGFEVARRVRTRDAGPLLIMLSFHDSRAARLEAWAAGADGFVPKSETTTRLMPLVGELLRRRGEGVETSVERQGPSIPTTRVPAEDSAE